MSLVKFVKQSPSVSISFVIFLISFFIYLGGVGLYLAGCNEFGWSEDRGFVRTIYYVAPVLSILVVIGNFFALFKSNRQTLVALPILNISLSLLYIPVVVGAWEHYTLNDVLIVECDGWRTAENPTINYLCGKIVSGLGMLIAGSLVNAFIHAMHAILMFMRARDMKKEEHRLASSMLNNNALDEDDLTLDDETI